jgi:hypothetical protein
MVYQSPETGERVIPRLRDQIALQQQAVDALRARGHVCTDAERHLADLKEALLLLR